MKDQTQLLCLIFPCLIVAFFTLFIMEYGYLLCMFELIIVCIMWSCYADSFNLLHPADGKLMTYPTMYILLVGGLLCS